MKTFIKLFSVVLVACLCVVYVNIRGTAISVSAKGYCLINADTFEVLAGENIHKKLPMASTTKIMTSLILAELGDLDREIVTTEQMVTVEGSSMGLLAGDKVSYYELMVGMLLPSGNDAANSVAIAVAGSVEKFAELMNAKAQEIGMRNTNFVTPSGLDSEEHYSTAYDMALLGAYALKNDTIREIVSKESITVSFGNPPYQRTLYNHNKLLNGYDNCIGIKTGYTKKSGRCLVSAAKENGCTVVAVTLNAPNDWSDHKELLQFGLSQISQKDVTADVSCDVSVVGGVKESVSVSTERFICGLSNASSGSVTSKKYIKPFVYAPISSGQTLGTVEYYYNGKIIKTTDIISLESVDIKVFKPTFKQRFLSALRLFFRLFI